MFSVFPQYLMTLAHNRGMTSSGTLSEALRVLNNDPQLECPYLICPTPEDYRIDYVYKLATTKKLREFVSWCYRNILLVVDNNYATASVRLRIAAGMLNNLEKEGVISQMENIVYHSNLVFNINEVWYVLVTENLPF